jgi:hypothetical protein
MSSSASISTGRILLTPTATADAAAGTTAAAWDKGESLCADMSTISLAPDPPPDEDEDDWLPLPWLLLLLLVDPLDCRGSADAARGLGGAPENDFGLLSRKSMTAYTRQKRI